MMMVQRIKWRYVLLIAFCLGLGGIADGAAPKRGQDPYARLTRSRFKYSDDEIRKNVLALTAMPSRTMDAADKFRLSYYMREWAVVRDTLRKMPPATAEKVYHKIALDLTRERAPVMTAQDFYGLLDACPKAPADERITWLGNLAKVVVRPEERDLLGTRLELGTEFFGGKGYTERLNLGRIMLQAGFDDLAGRFLPPVSDMDKIKDENLHRWILQFHKTQAELTGGSDGQKSVEDLTKDFDAAIKGFYGDVASRKKASNELLGFFAKRLPHSAVLDAVEKHLKGPGEDITPALVSRLSEVFDHYRSKNAVPLVRLNNIILQLKLADVIVAKIDLKKAPWNPVAISLAGNWIAEAEEMVRENPVFEETGKDQHFLWPQDLLATMPKGEWLRSLPEGVQERVLLLYIRILMSDNKWDDAFKEIVDGYYMIKSGRQSVPVWKITEKERICRAQVPVNIEPINEYYARRTASRIPGLVNLGKVSCFFDVFQTEVFNYVNGKNSVYDIYLKLLAEELSADCYFTRPVTLNEVENLINRGLNAGFIRLK